MSETASDEIHIQAGHVLFREGDLADCAYVVKTGEIEVVKAAGSPDERIVDVIGADQLLGEMGPLDDSPRAACARARSDASLKVIERSRFLQYISTNPQAARTVMQRLSARLRSTTAALGDGGAPPGAPELPAVRESDFSAPRGPARTALVGGVVTVLVAAAAIAGAAVTRVETVVGASGEVTTDPPPLAVEPAVTAPLGEMLVEPGARVEAGETLVKLDPGDLRDKLKARRASLTAARARLDRRAAEAEALADPETGLAKSGEDTLLDRRLASVAARLADFDARIAGARDRVENAEAVVDSAREQVALERETLARKRDLVERGAVPRADVETAEKSRARAKVDLNEARRDAATARADLSSARAGRAAFLAERRARVSDRLERARERVERLAGEVAALETRLARHVVRAPVAGVVSGTPAEEAGTVMQPTDALVRLVRADAPRIVRADVRPRDIDGVRAGMPVSIKLEALPFQRFGEISGEVVHVSGDTRRLETRTAAGAPARAYEVRVALDADAPPGAPADFRLKPGMQVKADLVTGSRTVLSYLTDPLIGTVEEAFREPR
jgi:HlyD family type I secretion membrane fusion protein